MCFIIMMSYASGDSNLCRQYFFHLANLQSTAFSLFHNLLDTHFSLMSYLTVKLFMTPFSLILHHLFQTRQQVLVVISLGFAEV